MIVRSHHIADAQGLDLRRRPTRLQAEALTRRARQLKAGERQLIEDLFEDGRPCSTIAAELGRNARAVRREARGIAQRLLDPRFEFVTIYSPAWRPTRRRIAESLYIHGMGLRQTARQLRLSLYSVRRHRDAIDALFEAHTHADEQYPKGGACLCLVWVIGDEIGHGDARSARNPLPGG